MARLKEHAAQCRDAKELSAGLDTLLVCRVLSVWKNHRQNVSRVGQRMLVQGRSHILLVRVMRMQKREHWHQSSLMIE